MVLREVLMQPGVSPRFRVGRLDPCPICGSRDRCRYDDRGDTGSCFCNQYSAVDGIILLRKLNELDHATACREGDAIIGGDQRVREPPQANSGPPTRRAVVTSALRWKRGPMR